MDMETQIAVPGVGQPNADHASKSGQSERSRRYRARKRAGRLVATVEIDELVLALLSQGAKIGADELRQDRVKLNGAVSRALRHYALRLQKTGRING